MEIEIPNPGQKLKPGMFSRVQISYQSKEMVQAVPLSALTSEDGVSGVYVVDPQERTVLFTPVQTGIQNADFVEIISPILDAEVVTLGHDLLEDGRKVSTESKTGADAK